MLKDCVAVLNIGPSSVNITVCEKSVNGTFLFHADKTYQTYAFYNGAFTDVKSLEKIISDMLEEIKLGSPIGEITKFYVNVPGEFAKTETKNYQISFSNERKITTNDVISLFNLAYTQADCEYTLINRSAVYYIVNNVKTNSPVGQKSSGLSGRLSYVLVSNNYKENIDKILKDNGVKVVKYISQDFAENYYLFGKEPSETRIFIDVDVSTTSISIASGNGLLFSTAIPTGGGLLSANLGDVFGVDFEISDALKDKINLGLRQNDKATYIISDYSLGDFTFSRNNVNDIAREFLDGLAEQCDGALSKCTLKIPTDIDIYFTGSGICNVRGAVEYLASRLGVLPKIVKPFIPHYDKPQYSSKISLLATSLDYAKDKIFFNE